MTALSGWGRYPVVDTESLNVRSMPAVSAVISHGDGLVARGAGRAYGDAAIGAKTTLHVGALDRMRAFDPLSGVVTVEAGVLLADLIATFGPRGFFPAVVPGTRFVTVGGAIAADVHGKNHHRSGGFGRHVLSLSIVTADGVTRRAAPDENVDLFFATIGGMGLTGCIVEATLQLMPIETGYIRQTVAVAPDLDAAITALDRSDDATYSVAWIDGTATGRHLGRSLILVGDHARCDEVGRADVVQKLGTARLSIPFDLPSMALNRVGVRVFNELYFQAGRRHAGRSRLTRAERYFFPLDGIGGWNRMYGRAGFVQYQFVIPLSSKAALAEIVGRIAVRGDASFLTVLKKLGPGTGILSFPMRGYTLALDFPMRAQLLPFLDELDRLVVSAGGRLYLAKDARQSRATFEATYPAAQRFRAVCAEFDVNRRIRSHLSERLGL